jgi:vacuolar-type H+-ATPase subunit D/Vma8
MFFEILGGIYGVYCCTFCFALAQAEYNDRRKMYKDRMREYKQLSRLPTDIEISMTNESISGFRLPTIEEIEEVEGLEEFDD